MNGTNKKKAEDPTLTPRLSIMYSIEGRTRKNIAEDAGRLRSLGKQKKWKSNNSVCQSLSVI